MATIKQKKAVKITLENSGIVSKAMLDAGYSPTVAKTPSVLTSSKGWAELMEKHISDDKLAKVHDEGLEATKIHGTGDDFIEIPDFAVRHKYMDTGYKLKGKLVDKSVRLNIDISKVLDEIEKDD